jgi:D-amino-acid dehydrogenase
MKIIVLGAGVVGVTTAYFLAKKGYEVTVIDKNSSCAQGASYGNGGQLSYADIDLLSSKSSLLSIFKASFKPNSYFSIKDLFAQDLLKWSYEFFKNCSTQKVDHYSKNLLLLSLKSKKALSDILALEGDIKFNYQESGILHFFRNQKLFDQALERAEFKKSLGVKLSILDAKQCIKKEPTLVNLYDNKELVGGILYLDDAVGDSYLFTKSLEEICRKKYNVNFEYDCDIKNIFTNHKKVTGINTSKGVFTADKYIYSLGAYCLKLLNGIGINSKIYPLKGYSLSIPTDEEFLSPMISLTDEENRIVYTRLGNSLRVAGTFEMNGLKIARNQGHVNFLKSTISSTFADFGNLNKAQDWWGFRPFRPNSTPLVCQIKKYGNFYLNSGHGSRGWTLACGSAEIIADLVSDINHQEFEFLKEEEDSISIKNNG